MAKPGPKENLLPGQEDNINNMFYRDYMLEYFDEKVMLLVDLLSNSDDYSEKLLLKEFKIGKLNFKTDTKTDKNNLEKFAKCEIVETYYHCLETFMRLFISHASFEPCPLIELTAIDNREYHKKLNQIASGNFENLNSKFSGDDTILMVLLGSPKGKNSLNDDQINNIRSWLVFCANELQRMSEYNSFKHGLSMFTGLGYVKINSMDGNEILKKEGDAIHILESKDREKQYKFSLSSIFVEYDFKIALIIFFNEMIKNILTIGKITYVTKDFKTKISGFHFIDYDSFKLRDIFYEKGDIGALLSSYEQPLFYIDDLEETDRLEKES